MNECLTIPQHKNKIGYWLSDNQRGNISGLLLSPVLKSNNGPFLVEYLFEIAVCVLVVAQ